ncbi:hexameric tyrosine-coordinated heme protein [Streptomyces pseudogriseolus]
MRRRAEDPGSLVADADVVALEFATIAAAGNYCAEEAPRLVARD